MKLIKFINNNWTDPVWSKVFAAGIIGLLSSIGLFVYSLISEIPFQSLWASSLSYLKTQKLEVTYLTILLIIFVLLIILIPMVWLKIISFQLKSIKVPSKLKTKDFNIESFLNGKWKCSYTRLSDGWKGCEILDIRNGNNYYLNNKLYFILTDIEVDLKNKKISWTKTVYPSNLKHSRESLKINSDELLIGTDNTGYEIMYSKHL